MNDSTVSRAYVEILVQFCKMYTPAWKGKVTNIYSRENEGESETYDTDENELLPLDNKFDFIRLVVNI